MMAEQTIAFEPQEKMPPLSRSEDHVTNVSYALIPKEVNVEISEEKIFFRFKYPITEDESIDRIFHNDGIKYTLEKSTKKILTIDFFLNHWKISFLQLDRFDKSIDSLISKQIRESVKSNYTFTQKLVHYFFENIGKSYIENRFD